MHQDIRPFPCTVCEQTFRQKAHLQRHEATHGIDSMANRKRRKRPLMDENDLEAGDPTNGGGGAELMDGDEEEEDIIYRPFVEKRKFAPAAGVLMKTEREEEEEETQLDPMIEPIVQQPNGSSGGGGPEVERKLLCPVNVGTNTEEMTRHHVVNDEIEESTLEPVRFRATPRLTQVEQGVQYCEEDLLQDDDEDVYHRHVVLDVKYATAGGTLASSSCEDSSGRLAGGAETGRSLRGGDRGHELKCEREEEESVGVAVCEMDEATTIVSDDGGESVTYSSQGEHYVTTVHGADNGQLIGHTADGSYIDASGSQLVMSHDGELVGFVPMDSSGQSQVVNISTSTNEHGQQVVIIENLHNHSPELQQEILRALMSDTNLIPISHT
jgi:hypothetical protein